MNTNESTQTPGSYEDACRAAAKRQMPDIPADLIDSLPIWGDDPEAMYLAQTGGFCMALEKSGRLMTQDGDNFLVGIRPTDDDEGDGEYLIYEGADFDTAFALLRDGAPA